MAAALLTVVGSGGGRCGRRHSTATATRPASSAGNGAGHGSIASVRHTLARISLDGAAPRQSAVDSGPRHGLFGVLCCHCTCLTHSVSRNSPPAGPRCWSFAAARTWPSAGSPSSTAPGGRCTPSTAAASGALQQHNLVGSVLKSHQVLAEVLRSRDCAPLKASSATWKIVTGA